MPRVSASHGLLRPEARATRVLDSTTEIRAQNTISVVPEQGTDGNQQSQTIPGPPAELVCYFIAKAPGSDCHEFFRAAGNLDPRRTAIGTNKTYSSYGQPSARHQDKPRSSLETQSMPGKTSRHYHPIEAHCPALAPQKPYQTSASLLRHTLNDLLTNVLATYASARVSNTSADPAAFIIVTPPCS